jgi:enoyl-CoA hydratase/carnithine racemase
MNGRREGVSFDAASVVHGRRAPQVWRALRQDGANSARTRMASGVDVVSIASVRGRTRGVGSEFVLARDICFASRQKAVFGQPEVGVGLIPGGGAIERLPQFVGRARLGNRVGKR